MSVSKSTRTSNRESHEAEGIQAIDNDEISLLAPASAGKQKLEAAYDELADFLLEQYEAKKLSEEENPLSLLQF